MDDPPLDLSLVLRGKEPLDCRGQKRVEDERKGIGMDEPGGSLVVLRDVGDTISRYKVGIDTFASIPGASINLGCTMRRISVYRTSLTGENIGVAEMEIIRGIKLEKSREVLICSEFSNQLIYWMRAIVITFVFHIYNIILEQSFFLYFTIRYWQSDIIILYRSACGRNQ